MHSYEEHRQRIGTLENMLRLASTEAELAVDAARRSGVYSPTPADTIIIKRAVDLALSLTIASQQSARLGPESIVPPEKSYNEWHAEHSTGERRQRARARLGLDP